MSAGHIDIEADQFATFEYGLTLYDANGALVDLTGCAAEMQVRDPDGAVLLDLSSHAGTLTLGGVGGTINISRPAGTLANWTTGKANAYDVLLLFPGGVVDRILEGAFTVVAGVTAAVTP